MYSMLFMALGFCHMIFYHDENYPGLCSGNRVNEFLYKNTIKNDCISKKDNSDCFGALQICAVELQWKCIEKTVILKNYRSLLLTFVRCIFYKSKIVILALFPCSPFCIELNAHITSFHCF